MAKVSKPTTKMVPLDQIDEPKGSIRLEIDMEEVQGLAENISEEGLHQHIIVRPCGERFEIVAGHRRYLAFKRLNRKVIPTTVRDLDDASCAMVRASENIRRVNLSPIEEAAIYSDLHENHGLRTDEIAKRMGKSPGLVMRRLDMLQFPARVQKAVHRKQISVGVAEELVRIKDPAQLDYFLGYAIEHGITIKVAQGWVDDWAGTVRQESSKGEGDSSPPPPSTGAPTYTPCHICHDPVLAGKGVGLMACRSCWNRILEAQAREANH